MTPDSAGVARRARAARLGADLISLLLPFLGGCAMTSKELPASPRDVRVEATIELEARRLADVPVPEEFAHVHVVLRNPKGKALETPQVRILLNGEPLAFGVGTGNYYDRYPAWRATEAQAAQLGPGVECRLEVEWPGGSRLPVGSVRLAPGLALDRFEVPREFRPDRDFTISWHGLTEAARLEVYRGYTYPDEAGNAVQMAGAAGDKRNIRKEIGPGFLRGGDGRLVVPRDWFKDQPGDSLSGGKPLKVNALNVEVRSESEARVGKDLNPGSRLTARHTLLFYMEAAAGS